MNIRYNNRSGCVTICTPKNMTPLSKSKIIKDEI